MAENLTPPEGFVLDSPEASLPKGFSIDQPTQPKKQDTGQMLQNMGLGAGIATGAGYGIGKAYEALAPQRNKLAGNLINSIIKPRHKDYLFGKNPGRGVAQEGIWGINLESIGKQVNQRLDELNTYAKEYRSLDANKTKLTNFENVFTPLKEALDELGKAPETHGAKIKELSGIINDLKGNIPEDFKTVPVETAYQAKKVVEGMQKWNVESTGDHIVNSALKKVYHNIDTAIDEVLPSLKNVNSRMANLISAKQAISHRAEILARKDPTELFNLVNALPHLVANTATKSGLAKILAEKFGLVKKAGMGTLGVYPMISQAIQLATDPEAAQVSAVGGELAPQGSEEREIQLGRLL